MIIINTWLYILLCFTLVNRILLIIRQQSISYCMTCKDDMQYPIYLIQYLVQQLYWATLWAYNWYNSKTWNRLPYIMWIGQWEPESLFMLIIMVSKMDHSICSCHVTTSSQFHMTLTVANAGLHSKPLKINDNQWCSKMTMNSCKYSYQSYLWIYSCQSYLCVLGSIFKKEGHVGLLIFTLIFNIFLPLLFTKY